MGLVHPAAGQAEPALPCLGRIWQRAASCHSPEGQIAHSGERGKPQLPPHVQSRALSSSQGNVQALGRILSSPTESAEVYGCAQVTAAAATMLKIQGLVYLTWLPVAVLHRRASAL